MSVEDLITVGGPATEALGRRLGQVLCAGDLIALVGDLGAGKTTLVRGLAAGAGVAPELVRSPTFVLHHVYRGTGLTLHHIDCYRLGEDADLGFLDLDELLAEGTVAIEWPPQEGMPVPPTARLELRVLDRDRRAVHLGAGAPPRLRRAFGGAR